MKDIGTFLACVFCMISRLTVLGRSMPCRAGMTATNRSAAHLGAMHLTMAKYQFIQ